MIAGLLSEECLNLDCEKESAAIADFIRVSLRYPLKRKGIVIAVSGGIDSAVTAALCVKAMGTERVFGLLMPERESSPHARQLSRIVAEHLQIPFAETDITPILESLECYRRRDEAVRQIIPEFAEGWKCKLRLPGTFQNTPGFRIFSIIVESPDGRRIEKRLTPNAYFGIVAATNFKQRTRKMLEYYHADRLNYAVAGTPNRLEYDQGFFVKNGDGSADIKPIAHLYKTQVYQMARYLELPEEISANPPATDTYSLPQTQEEFYFSLPYTQMDLCLYAKNNGFTPEQTAAIAKLTTEQVQRVFEDIDQKRKTTAYLHLKPRLACSVPEID